MDAAVTTALNSAIAGVYSDLTGVVTSNIPTILGLVAVTVGVPFGINLLRKFAR